MDTKRWFKEEAKFGLMIHWGLYSLLAGEYKGRRMDEIAEWIQSYFRIPNKEYARLANAFNPVISMRRNGSAWQWTPECIISS